MSLPPVLVRRSRNIDEKCRERLVEPDRAVSVVVDWVQGRIPGESGVQVQMRSSIGPDKGGLRFHRVVDVGLLMCLGFEQTGKGSLTTRPTGGGRDHLASFRSGMLYRGTLNRYAPTLVPDVDE